MTGKCTLMGTIQDYKIIEKISHLAASRDNSGAGMVYIKIDQSIPDSVEFRAHNLFCEATFRMKAKDVEGDCGVAVSSVNIGKVLLGAKSKGRLEVFENGAVLKGESSTYKINVSLFDASPYENIPIGTKLTDIVDPVLLGSLSAGVSRGDHSKSLEFAKIFAVNGMVKGWACDDRNFMQIVLGPANCHFSFLIHRGILNILTGFGQGTFYGDSTTISYIGEDFMVRFTGGGMPYPDLDKVALISKNIVDVMSLDSTDLADALDFALAVTHKDNEKYIKMSFKNDALTIACDSESGKSVVAVPGSRYEAGAKEWNIDFGAAVLAQSVRVFNGKIYFGMSNAHSPAFIARQPFNLAGLQEFVAVMPIIKA
jgi:hypothetical protein